MLGERRARLFRGIGARHDDGAFPTETVYALGAVATDAEAVKKVYAVKARPTDRPLIVAVAKRSDVYSVAKTVPDKARVLMEKFMTGALTVLLDRAETPQCAARTCRCHGGFRARRALRLSRSLYRRPTARVYRRRGLCGLRA